MIPNDDFLELIDAYLMDELLDKQKIEFEKELAKNSWLRKELKLRAEIRESIVEKDITELRAKIGSIINKNRKAKTQKNSFEILDQNSEIKEISEVLTTKELISFFDSLPKIHAYHHEISTRENIHPLQSNLGESIFKDKFRSEMEMEIESDLDGLEEAILEKDIPELRQKLKQVAKSVEPKYETEKIDRFLNNELQGIELLEFEEEMEQNGNLSEELALHREIEIALQERDIMDLRNKISSIIRTETSWNVSQSSIEDFIDGILEENLRDEFTNEFKDNTDLQAEVRLRSQINEAILERDIIDLRNELKSARKKSETNHLKMFVPEAKSKQLKFWFYRAAVFIVLIGITGIIGSGLVSVNKIYDNYYENPTWAPARSLESELSLLYEAKSKYQNKEYTDVIQLLNELPAELKQNPALLFYQAASMQNLGQYNNAIPIYSEVIENKDNLFIEEAEWYRSLCYLKLGRKSMAKQELVAIINRKGDFEKDAKAILRRLRFSVKN